MQNDSQKEKSRVAVVTGGSSGIGNAIVKKLAEDNIRTIVADITSPKEEHANAFYFKTDITSGDDINALYEYVTSNHHTPDILVCNAGRGIHERLHEGDPEKWADILNLNIMGTLRTVRAFLPAMKDRENAQVVFISSFSANHVYPWGGVYAATKSAIEKIAATLRLELQPEIKVTVISPGVVETSFFRNMMGNRHTPEDIGYGALPPEEIADAVIYAVSRHPQTSINYISLSPKAQPV